MSNTAVIARSRESRGGAPAHHEGRIVKEMERAADRIQSVMLENARDVADIQAIDRLVVFLDQNQVVVKRLLPSMAVRRTNIKELVVQMMNNGVIRDGPSGGYRLSNSAEQHTRQMHARKEQKKVEQRREQRRSRPNEAAPGFRWVEYDAAQKAKEQAARAS